MTVAWLRHRDGTLWCEVEEFPFLENPTTRRRLEAGQCRVSIPLGDPCMTHTGDLGLLWDDPDDPEKPWKDWSDSDIELALWAEGIYGEEPAGDPTWAGPVVSVRMVPGRLEVMAWTKEAYLTRSPVGGRTKNWAANVSLDVDPDLDEWDTGVAYAVTTDLPPLYGDQGRAVAVAGTITAIAVDPDAAVPGVGPGPSLPKSDDGNYANVKVPVFVPSGVALGSTWAAAVELQTADTPDPGDGYAWASDPDYVWVLELPADWEPSRWYLLEARVPQPAGREVRYRVSYYGFGYDPDTDDPLPVRFGSWRLERPENVSAVPDTDYGTFPAAVYDQQLDLLPSGFTRDNDEVGVDLAEPMIAFSEDHASSVDVVKDLDGLGEGWVTTGGVLRYAAERGVERPSVTFDVTTLSGWSWEVDATGASTELVGQMTLEGGGRDELWVGGDGPNRLLNVLPVPEGIGAGDAKRWLLLALEKAKPAKRLSGIPAPTVVPSAGVVADWGVGDWFDVEIVNGPISFTVQPVVAAVEWDPVTHRVKPVEWALGGDARRSDLEIMAARLKFEERKRREAKPPRWSQATRQTWTVPSADLGLSPAEHLFSLPPGLKVVSAHHSASGGDRESTGVTITEAPFSPTGHFVRGPGSASMTTRARAVTVGGLLGSGSVDPTTRNLTIRVMTIRSRDD